jgi:hypothetical protein
MQPGISAERPEMEIDQLLKRGIAALKAGRRKEAHRLLTQVVERDERNETAWLWLSGAVETDEERRVCLENALVINPENTQARRGLELLVRKVGVRPLKIVASPIPKAQLSQRRPVAPSAREKTPIWKWLLVAGGAAVVLLFISCLLAYVLGAIQLPGIPVAGSISLDSPSAEERARMAEHVALHRGSGDTLDGWCAAFAIMGYGERTSAPDSSIPDFYEPSEEKQYWTATLDDPNSEVWTVECLVNSSTVTSQGESTRPESVMLLLYNTTDGYIYVQNILGATSAESLRLLAFQFDIEDVFGQPKIYAPLD